MIIMKQQGKTSILHKPDTTNNNGTKISYIKSLMRYHNSRILATLYQ